MLFVSRRGSRTISLGKGSGSALGPTLCRQSGRVMKNLSRVLRPATAFWLLSALLAPVAQGEPPDGAVRGSSISAVASRPARGKWKKRWIGSWLAVAAVSALDIHSSQGHGEANPLFRTSSGQFAGGKATLIKSAIGGGLFVSQLLIIRARPGNDCYKPFTVVNTVTAAALGGVVVRNYSLPAPARRAPQSGAPQN